PQTSTHLRAFGCTVPPSKYLARTCTWLVLVTIAWSVLWSVIGQDLLPGGNIFAIFVVIICASFFGMLVKLVPYLQLPPLLGMLVAGLVLRNVPYIDFAKHIDKKWSSTLRSIALAVILVRSGLGLNTDVLQKCKFTVMRLAFIPCTFEVVTAAVMASYILGMKWQWAFQLGFVQAAVSLAVVIPALLEFQEKFYGTNKGIPTLVMAAASFDNVLCISGFGVCIGLSFHSGNLVFNIFRAPIEVLIGLAFGVFMGFLCWWFPNKTEERVSRSRFLILLGGSMLAVFGSKAAQFAGAGALAALIMSTLAAYGWGKQGKAPIAQATALLWMFFEPLLFGLVGAEVSIDYLDKRLVGIGIGILASSLVVRTLITYLTVTQNNLNRKEKMFIAIAWLPKATVQAAIGSISLDTARLTGFTGQYHEEFGIQV
ncbi:predicted protein, partial [Nematostella vectensis]